MRECCDYDNSDPNYICRCHMSIKSIPAPEQIPVEKWIERACHLEHQLALARGVLAEGLERMKLINGDKTKCVTDPYYCANHQWIDRAQQTLAKLSETKK